VKLERMFAIAAVLGALAMGCGASASTVAPLTTAAPTVGTTHVTAADADDIPRIGTPRYSRDDAFKDDASDRDALKDQGTRHGEHRRGGGFSGYK
jgi:hypothetical protein